MPSPGPAVEVSVAELARELGRGLAPLYLVTGDEPLQVQETCDAIIGAARAADYAERIVLHADTAAFNWDSVLQEAASRSLFAARRIIDVRVQGAAFGREGAAALTTYAQAADPDTLLLLRAGRLDRRQRTSGWYKALVQAGVVVTVWPIAAADLPRWLERRLRQAGLSLTRDALYALAERVEGNLLAAVQEIQKLTLHELAQPIGFDQLLAVLEDAAHYDVFELIDSVMAGDPARVVRMVANLRQEGVAVFAVLGAFTAQLRRIGGKERLAPQRQRLIADFQRRQGGRKGIDTLLAISALIDAQGKGELPGDPWRSLEELLLGLCGARLLAQGTGLDYLRATASTVGPAIPVSPVAAAR
jgi:DNA polymerase-3 subunit delta